MQKCNNWIEKIDYDLASGCILSLSINISMENCVGLLEDSSLPSSPSATYGDFSDFHLQVEFAGFP